MERRKFAVFKSGNSLKNVIEQSGLFIFSFLRKEDLNNLKLGLKNRRDFPIKLF